MLKYFISLLLILISFSSTGQEKEVKKEKDTITKTYKDRYGLRVGIDLFNPINSFFNEERKGLEFVADYRLTNRFFIASEFGYLENTDYEDFFNFSTNGQYLKVGADYNAYKNWIGMENMIIVGVRYAYSTFDQTLNEYTINADPFLPLETSSNPIQFNNLNAQWVEFILGLKVEVLHNVFLGCSFRGNILISENEPENFKNLFIPGFNKVSSNDKGFSFNYTISYLIPLYKK